MDDEQAHEATDQDVEEIEDVEEETPEQIALEKQIDKFRKLWMMLDSPVDNERETAFRSLYKTIAKINDLHEQITDERGSLNFADLLDKIENNGGGEASAEELEHMQMVLAQYEEANGALKIAENMLGSEVRMLRFLLQTKGYEKVSIENPDEIITQLIEKAGIYQELCDDLKKLMQAAPQDVNNVYTQRLGDLQQQQYEDLTVQFQGVSANIATWFIRRQGLPATVEDLMEIQALTKAQDIIIRKDRNLLTRVNELETVVKDLNEALRCVLHKTYVDDSLREMLANLEHLETRIQHMEDLEERISEGETEISTLRDQLSEWQDENARQTQSIHILNETIDQLRASQRINAPLEAADFSTLNMNNPEDVRKSCEILVAVAQQGPTESRLGKDDLKRENQLLRKQVAVLKDGTDKDRYDIIERTALQRLIETNEELESAMTGYRHKLTELLGEADDWEGKYEAQIGDIKAEHQADIDALQAEHAQALATAESEIRAEFTAQATLSQSTISTLKLEKTKLETQRTKYRRNLLKDASKQSRSSSILAMATGLAIGGGVTMIADQNHPELFPWNEAHTAEQNQETVTSDPLQTRPSNIDEVTITAPRPTP